MRILSATWAGLSGRRKVVPLLCCFLCVSLQALDLQSIEASGDPPPQQDLRGLEGTALDVALKAIGLGREDLSVGGVPPAAGLELRAVAGLLQRPLESAEYAQGLADRLQRQAGKPTGILNVAIEELDVQPDLAGAAAGAESDSATMHAGSGDDIGKIVASHLAVPMSRSRRLMVEAFARLTEDEVTYVARHLPSLWLEDGFERNIVRRHRLEKQEREEVKKLLAIVQKVDRAKLYAAACLMAKGVETMVDALRAERETGGATARRPSDGDPKVTVNDDLGTWVVGSFGDDLYDRAYDVIVDPGGNDTYLGEVGGAGPGRPVSVIVDLAGNDTYRSEESFSLAGAQMGISILVDCSGDDVYEVKHYALGCGLLGIGLLLDMGGNDEYIADTVAQGAGVFGIGVLSDTAGDDRYSAALYSQGFGSTLGFGALLDTSGDDEYVAGGRYVDRLRYADHYRSMSQGFGLGIRPMAPGGIGALVDSDGDDTYTADIFAQGSSYWHALGVLADADGNDRYLAHRYAQGAAVHQSVAVCIDEAGDDSYISGSVSMGCGHDLAVGIALDIGGNDSYRMREAGLGAGIANGLGIHVDVSGKDSYRAEKRTCLGSGAPARNFDSIGVMLDLQGDDTYSLKGRDNALWTVEGRGVGYDANQ